MVMNIRVLTPDRVICSTAADEVVLPGLTGQVGVLDGHAALITALDTGLLMTNRQLSLQSLRRLIHEGEGESCVSKTSKSHSVLIYSII
jgi:F0F1-type ATP synthase epsilon subunit